MFFKVRQNYLCGHSREKCETPCTRLGGCTKLSCCMYKEFDRGDPAENYCNPCSKYWKYKDLQAQIDATRAARDQRKNAAKRNEKDDAKAKKEKEKEKEAKGKGKGTETGKAKPVKNAAVNSTKRGTKRPRDGDDQEGPAPKRMGGQLDGTFEPMHRGRPLGRIPVYSTRDASPPLAAEPSPVLPSREQPADAPDEASEVGSTKSFISKSEYEHKCIQNYDETSSEGTSYSEMSASGDSDNESQSAGEESSDEFGSDRSSSEFPTFTTHDSSELDSESESSSSSESEQEPEEETDSGSDIKGGGRSDDEPGTVDFGPENSDNEPSDEEPPPSVPPSPSPSRAGGI